MAFKPGYRARILNGDFSLSAKLSQASGALAVDMLDSTVFADDGDKRFIPGIDSSTFSCEGFIDAATAADNAAWTDAQPITYGQEGIALGSPVLMVNAIKSSYELGSQVAGVASFNLDGTTDGPTDFGVSLHDLTEVTADENGASVDNGAQSTNGAVAHLHVSAFSGFSGAVVTIADSANNSAFATIGTFTTVAGVTSERIAITGTVRRYVRYSIDVTGTGAITFAASLARH